MTQRTRYAIAGLGGRSNLFSEAILGTYRDSSMLVGLCDVNLGRLELARQRVEAESGAAVGAYGHADFDRMIAETRPDTVIVTTKDCTHDVYIVRAMELGCDVITEKPMTTDATKCRRILDVQQQTGQKITVTFNYRYAPPRTQVKELLMAGVIGNVVSVDFHWMLDTEHGADYFRRWHRNKVNSGGLMVHKATHHFDLVNWWLSTVPARVTASGDRRFYLPETAERFGLTDRGERCRGCAEAARCPFYLDLAAAPAHRALYLESEEYDGYFRDRCVFSPEIDIEDNMSVIVDYRNGARMSYSLTAFSPWEGYTISFNGTHGRLEHKMEEATYINGDGRVPGALKPEGTWIRVYPHFDQAYEIAIDQQGGGGHGGADPIMLDYIFAPERQPPDPLLRAADQRAGAWSIMTGVAANASMASGRPVTIAELVGEVDLPAYPPMPDDSMPLPLPPADNPARRT